MLWVPKKGKLLVRNNMASGTGDNVTTHATVTSTKGTPTEIFSATTFDSYLMHVFASNYGLSATASEGSMDILVGASAERVLIADLQMGYCGGATGDVNIGGWKQWLIPIYIPAGTRLAVQAAGVRLATTVRVGIFLYGGDGYPPFRVAQKCTTYGIGTVPNGPTMTVGASGAEGTWAQMTASSVEDHFAFFPSFQVATDTTTSARNLLVDIGIGAAAAEELIGESYIYTTTGVEHMGGPWPCLPTFQDVPSGTRLAMRAMNTSTNDAAYNGVLHALS